jgi:putative Holliday junction resolvase
VRILAVDPGEKHIGLAVSDPTGLVARPLLTLTHTARAADVERILALAAEHGAGLIVVGCPLDSEGRLGPQALRVQRLAEAMRAAASVPVELHDESFSSQEAESALRAAGKKRRARRGQAHAAAAATILQSYLDAHPGQAAQE